MERIEDGLNSMTSDIAQEPMDTEEALSSAEEHHDGIPLDVTNQPYSDEGSCVLEE